MATLAVAAVAAGAWFSVPYDTNQVHATYTVDMSTPALVAGWADDVFVATVDKRQSAKRDGNDLLYTPYEVTVTSALQGKVNGVVVVAQEGGDDPITRERIVYEGATALQPGKRYILATRISGQNGWHLAPSNFTPVEVAAGAAGDTLLATWKNAVAHPQDQKSVLPSSVETAQNLDVLYEKAEVS